MGRTFVLAVALAGALAGCSKKKTDGGLPPAQDWGADQPPPASAAAGGPHAADTHMGDPNDPHAGMDMGGGGDPHAGMDMGGGGGDPHGGAGGGVDVTKMGLAAPNPNRKIDPSHHIRGTIVLDAKAKGHASAGGAVFVIAKRADASGNPSGPPLAVEKLTWGSKDELPFELTEVQAMVGGTELAGDVVVTARFDQDGDALSKQPGDVTGQIRIKVPADGIKLSLDTVLP
jgi:hypothetical protein